MCQHQPRCPQSRAPDHLAARIAAAHPEQGWSMLCNGVIVLDDGGELLPDGRAIPRAVPPWPVRWQWPPEAVMTLTMSSAKAQPAIRTRPVSHDVSCHTPHAPCFIQPEPETSFQ